MRVNLKRWLALALLVLLCVAADGDARRAPASPATVRAPLERRALLRRFLGGLGTWNPDQPGVWTLSHGMVRADLPDQKQLRSLLRAGDPAWRDYALDLDVCMIRGVDKGAVVRLVEDTRRRRGPARRQLPGRRRVRAGVAHGQGARRSTRTRPGTTCASRCTATGCRSSSTANRVLDHARAGRTHGGIALAAYTGGSGECTVYYDNVVVTAL